MTLTGENVDFLLRNSKPEETKQGGAERGERGKKVSKPSKQLTNLRAFHCMMKNIPVSSHTFAVKILQGNYI